MAGLNDTDIKIDVNDSDFPLSFHGDAGLVEGDGCWIQDIRIEARTQEGELFYDTGYGWSLYDFLHRDGDDLTRLEIAERIKKKLGKRTEIDLETLKIEMEFEDDALEIKVEFSRYGDDKIHTVDVNLNRISVEVVMVD